MIDDAHAHIGVVPGTYDMPPQMQLDAMTRYGIDYALVSDIRAGETQTPPDGHTDFGVQINAEAADTVRRHADLPQHLRGQLGVSRHVGAQQPVFADLLPQCELDDRAG